LETLVILNKEAFEQIHEAALEVLQDVGVRVDDQGIAKLLEDAGATVRNGNEAHLPRTLVEWAIQQAPRTLRIADRTGTVRELGPGSGTMVLTGNALYITRGRVRQDLNSQDLAELTRIADACKNIHGMVGTSIADYPPAGRDFAGFRIMAQNTAKHLRPCIYSPRGARLVLEMAQVLLRGSTLRERPIVSTGFSIVSPLHWTSLALGVFRETAGFGVPVMINSEPLAGATSPVTLAGSLVIGDADVLSGLVINQILEPGRPCFYNIGFAHVMDMASTIALTAAPESTLIQAAGTELARYHRLPCASWMSTEAPIMDAQASFEKMMTGMAHATAGVNFIWGAGNLECTLAMSPEAMVADNEIAGYFLRWNQGIEVTPENIALDVIRGVGLSGDFLTSEHTLEHFRQVLSRPVLASRSRRADWEARGGRSFEESASAEVERILACPPHSHLSEHEEAELMRIERSGLEAIQ
jgi:trimethylamine:corrinoid methyltransferase-like protein